MKKILTSMLILVSMMSCVGNEKKQEATKTVEQTVKRYKVKTGKLTYKTTISGKILGGTIKGKGTETRCFKNWGAVELVETKETQTTTVNILGNRQTETTTEHAINKLDNGENYIVDFQNKKIYANRAAAIDLINTLEPNADAGKVGKKMLEGIGGKEIGKEHLQGVVSDVWEVPGGKQWFYKGVLLKSVVTIMGVTTVTEVVSMNFDVNIDKKYFQLPDFPIVKQQGFITNSEFNEELNNNADEMKREMDKMKNMSFKDWKKEVTKNDEEMRAMNDDELRKIYNMMQLVIQNKK